MAPVLPAGLFFGLNITLFFTAINHTSIAHAEFIAALSPLLLVPAGALFFDEQPNRRALAWGSLSIVGLAIVLAFGGDQGGATLGGDALMLVVVCTWVGYLLTSRRARATVDVVDFMATVMPIGLLTAAPLALLLAGDELWPLGGQGVDRRRAAVGAHGHARPRADRRRPARRRRRHDRDDPGLPAGARRRVGYLLLGEEIRLAQVPGMVLVLDRPRRVHARVAASRPRSGGRPTNTGSSLDRWAERVAAATDPRT